MRTEQYEWLSILDFSKNEIKILKAWLKELRGKQMKSPQNPVEAGNRQSLQEAKSTALGGGDR